MSVGCHDNRMDKISWNEQFMGWPVGPEYAASSNVVHASQLTGRLMLLVGELDTNVDPSSTYQVANALIKANKDFDLLIMPNQPHGFGGHPYFVRRRWDYFVEHLLGVEPPAGYEIGADCGGTDSPGTARGLPIASSLRSGRLAARPFAGCAAGWFTRWRQLPPHSAQAWHRRLVPGVHRGESCNRGNAS